MSSLWLIPLIEMVAEEYRRLKDKGKENLLDGNSEKAVEYYTRAIEEAKRLIKDEEGSRLSTAFVPQDV